MKLPDTPFLQHQPSQGEKRCRNRSWEVLKYAIHVLYTIHMYFAMFLTHMQIAGSSKIFIISILKTILSLKILFQNGNGSLEFRNSLQYRSSILSCFLFSPWFAYPVSSFQNCWKLRVKKYVTSCLQLHKLHWRSILTQCSQLYVCSLQASKVCGDHRAIIPRGPKPIRLFWVQKVSPWWGKCAYAWGIGYWGDG